MTAVTEWLNEPRAGAGVRFLGPDWEWRTVPYSCLRDRVLGSIGALADCGAAGRRLAVVMDDAEAVIPWVFAVLATGGTLVPILPRAALRDRAGYESRVRGLLAATNPFALVGPAGYDGLGCPRIEVGPVHDFGGTRVEAPYDPGDAALVQFSSGTTGAPKPIRLSYAAVDATVGGVQRWLRIGLEDAVATWLPLYHDMGLIGTTMVPIASQIDLFVMTPMQFLRRPDAWLECFGRLGCTLTAAPPFGYDHVIRRADSAAVEDFDLSRWRGAIVGAEPIRAATLRDFAARFGACGFSIDAFCPAYGAAEATLTVTGVSPHQPVRIAERVGADVVSSGPPLPGNRVEVRDLAGAMVPDGSVGEIWITGPGLADGYDDAGLSGFEAGWFRTGDAGFVDGDDLFVLGRISETFKFRGRVVFVEQAEATIRDLLPAVRAAAVIPTGGSELGITVVVEADASVVDATEMSQAISLVYDDMPVEAVVVRALPRTSSGKIDRRACWSRFAAGAPRAAAPA